jgi:CubicO group peptidase (beta-lactamase class C family)
MNTLFWIACLAQFADAKSTDPKTMGWMQGAPPPPGKVIRLEDARVFPQSRWAFSNGRQFSLTVAVPRVRSTKPLPVATRPLNSVTFHPIGSPQKTMTWQESLEANYTDGILVMHDGKIVEERYFGVLTPEKQHILFSVTKSFAGTLGAMLIAEGRLDANALAQKYVPELAGSALGDATIRQLLDMTTGPRYTEDYTDPNAGIMDFSRAANLLTRPKDYSGPETTYDYLKTLAKEHPHGERFHYKTINTDTLAWILARVTGKPLHQLLHERIWSKIGLEEEAYFRVDSVGVPFAGGGLHLTLRDMARFGEMMRLRQVVPSAVIDDIQRGGDKQKFAAAGYKTIPGWSYRNMWWVSHNANGAYMARGIHGQCIYVDPTARMVIARFASHPLAGNVNNDATTLPAFEAVARYLNANQQKPASKP